MKNFRLLLFIGLLCMLSHSTCKKPEPETNGNITGTVTDKQTYQPVKAMVSIDPDAKQMITSDDGVYKFENLDPSKTYKITATANKYLANSISNVSIIAGVTSVLDIQISPVSAELSVSPTTLDFNTLETSKTLSISNVSGIGAINYTLTTPQNWICISPTSGTVTNQINLISICVNRTNLMPNTYTGSVVINSNINSVVVNVQMVVPNSTPPTVTTESATNITQTTADIAGNVTNVGSGYVTQHGHCWSTSPNPTVNDYKTTLGNNTSTTFTSNLTGLLPNQTYYVRAYATNSVGTSYSSSVAFTTLVATPSLPPVVINGLVAYYTFDDGTANDMSTIYNGSLLSSILATDKPNANGYSVSLSSNSYINISANPFYSFAQNNTANASFCFWIKSNSYGPVFAADVAYAPLGFLLIFRSDNKLYYNSSQNYGYGSFNYDVLTNILNGQWNFVVVTIKPYEHYLYVNGKLVSQITTNSYGINACGRNAGAYIGKCTENSDSFFSGKLDNIRIYNRVLSITEILQIYNAKQ